MGKHEEQDAELTAQEAAVYDRQMRLWGVEAQKRLQNSHILISGMTQLGSEVAKNLVLSGMSVTLHDVNVVTRANVDTQFFLTEDQIGLNIYLDNLCREKNIAFYAGHAFGLSGIFFCDLGNEHVYRRHVQSTDAPSDTTTVPELKVSYPSLETSALVTWSSLKPTRKRSPVTPAPYIAYQRTYCLYLDERFLRSRGPSSTGGLPGFFDDHQLATLAATAEADVVPVCAIVAGILGQEVIKAISMKDEPLNNYFFFDGATGEGTVRRIG
ncbi:hypothetical protein DYB32_000469 [Aphanomyces invadans]|uniref:THIF-type NAD/FAD binding fold domain-containing protein n=1 Tax=Aphanomyces invadans TaxID=157072 RepID=A0A418B9Z1_9STRA|nr:hypothetical protein DYB32_000469 [Aphanomyces invadans]